jgi:hypothetical protein
MGSFCMRNAGPQLFRSDSEQITNRYLDSCSADPRPRNEHDIVATSRSDYTSLVILDIATET